MLKLPNFIIQQKITLLLVLAVLLLVAGGIFAFNKISSKQTIDIPLEEVELPFDPEGPYALVLPRRDGNAINLNIKRVSSYEQIFYELAYQAEGIDRGVQGTINTEDQKSEYLQEILFGTCSKGDTFSTLHCVFDKNVENGTLVLKNKKDNKLYVMNTTWHFQKPDIALGKITSGDNHFIYTTKASREDLALVGFSAVNDLTGVPKLPDGKVVLGKVYSLNVPVAKVFPKGEVFIELIDNAPEGAVIAHFPVDANDWKILDTKIDKNKLTASAESGGIFAVLIDAQK